LTTNEVASKDLSGLLHKALDQYAPEGLSAVTFTRGGQGVEKAILTAIAERGPGKWSALGFAGSTHGNHTSFSLAGFRGSPKLPGLNWPILSYPTAQNESAVLESVRSSLQSQRSSGSPVAAVVVEPMQSTTGQVASDRFLSELRGVTRDSESALIVDATETGCGATGKGFWGFNGQSDYLVFGKRTQVEGFFSTPESKQSSISFGGDQLRILQFETISDIIQKEGLVHKNEVTGENLKRSIE
jgi:4-aminobutyrate aminotransferase-like enzyme